MRKMKMRNRSETKREKRMKKRKKKKRKSHLTLLVPKKRKKKKSFPIDCKSFGPKLNSNSRRTTSGREIFIDGEFSGLNYWVATLTNIYWTKITNASQKV